MSLPGYRKLEIETIIDKNSLESVLEAIAEICHEKADHVLTNWQDKPLADKWSHAGKKIGRITTGGI